MTSLNEKENYFKLFYKENKNITVFLLKGNVSGKISNNEIKAIYNNSANLIQNITSLYENLLKNEKNLPALSCGKAFFIFI